MRDDAFDVLGDIVLPIFREQAASISSPWAFGADFGWRDGALTLTYPSPDASGPVVQVGPAGTLSYRASGDGATVEEVRQLPGAADDHRILALEEITPPLVGRAVRDFVSSLGWSGLDKPFLLR